MTSPDTVDYGSTIHLPKTDFPRRAGLAQKEPEMQKRWDKMDLFKLQREKSKGREKFILHFGPPFANGNIHLGHLLSKTLKDLVTRSYQMLGYDAPLVPGWDCHGLPIEWKIEEKYRAEKRNIDKDANSVEFRTECREYAAHWTSVQSGEFQRLGILGDFKNPYSTMFPKSEAAIAAEIHKFLLNGGLYRGSKPVMWSIPEQTALAEAEVEYKDVTSDTAFVKFPIKKTTNKLLEDASVVIWTTTPWTLPGNRAVAYGENIEYVGVEIAAVAGDEADVPNNIQLSCNKILVAETLLPELKKENVALVGADGVPEVFWRGKGSDFAGVICHHPLHGKGYEFDVPMLAGDFVTADAGTGFVHIAPGHGEDDYHLGVANKIEVPHTVQGDGKYFEHVPLFAGTFVYDAEKKYWPANKLVMNAIAESGNLVAKKKVPHSYPHSWRSKAPVIFRNTPQWFISMETNDLRAKAMAEIKKTRWVPARGENRIGSMVEGRGDWCVSRQRAWGVPIAIFVNKETGEPLRDEKVLSNIISIFEKEGSDAWYARPASDFLGSSYNADDFEQIKDIIDVWFESGSTHAFVLEQRLEQLATPADLYLEGSDQHRGWFQSSLLESVGTRGRAPYKAVLTHGFILDEKGYKMSKSVGNVTSPIKLMENYGADVLRLWVAGSDYTEDIKFGENILKGHVDIYRRVRNTFCYLLGSFDGFKPADKLAYKDLGDFDKWVLHRLYALDKTVRQCILDFDFLKLTTEVHNFCSRDLSAFYFDVCKDTLYCEALNSDKRRAVVTVLDEVFQYLCHWLSPVLPFTTEEAWLSYKGVAMDDLSESIHLSTMPVPPAEWNQPELAATWDTIANVRSVVTGALELKRADKTIGASLEAAPKVYVEDTALQSVLQSVAFADVCITSGLQIVAGAAPDGAFAVQSVAGIGVVVEKAAGTKCARCWKYTDDVGNNAAHAELCARCAGVVQLEAKQAAA